jgi:deoxyribose-phosphate aldolase
MELKDILRRVDHTDLGVTSTEADIRALCADAAKYRTASVCVPQSRVALAAELLAGTDVAVCTVIGFPNGYDSAAAKVFQAKDAIRNGATEIDTVINVGFVKDGRIDLVLDELRLIKAACGDNILKVIVETCLLTEEEKIEMCRVVSESGADFIKTSTGFSSTARPSRTSNFSRSTSRLTFASRRRAAFRLLKTPRAL